MNFTATLFCTPASRKRTIEHWFIIKCIDSSLIGKDRLYCNYILWHDECTIGSNIYLTMYNGPSCQGITFSRCSSKCHLLTSRSLYDIGCCCSVFCGTHCYEEFLNWYVGRGICYIINIHWHSTCVDDNEVVLAFLKRCVELYLAPLVVCCFFTCQHEAGSVHHGCNIA